MKGKESVDIGTENALLSLMEEHPDGKDFSYESKIEEMESVQNAQGNMRLVSFGIVFILSLIGLMNYVNTYVGNIQSREKELSVMESIGMSDRQVKKMLLISCTSP